MYCTVFVLYRAGLFWCSSLLSLLTIHKEGITISICIPAFLVVQQCTVLCHRIYYNSTFFTVHFLYSYLGTLLNVQNCNVLSVRLYCFTVLHCAELHCTALHCTALYCTTLHCIVVNCNAQHCTALYYSALHNTELYCTVLL